MFCVISARKGNTEMLLVSGGFLLYNAEKPYKQVFFCKAFMRCITVFVCSPFIWWSRVTWSYKKLISQIFAILFSDHLLSVLYIVSVFLTNLNPIDRLVYLVI